MLRELSDWCFAACRVLGCGCMEVIASSTCRRGSSRRRSAARPPIRCCGSRTPRRTTACGWRWNLWRCRAAPVQNLRSARRSWTWWTAPTWGCCSTRHFCAGGSRPEELSALRGDRLFMVHVSDCPARAPFTAQRAESYWPGEGDAPLEELLRSVRATGYDGPCSVEVMDPTVLA